VYCINCGKQLEAGANFCPRCGSKLDSQVNEIQKSPAIKKNRTVIKREDANKNELIMRIFIILILCIPIIIFGIFSFFLPTILQIIIVIFPIIEVVFAIFRLSNEEKTFICVCDDGVYGVGMKGGNKAEPFDFDYEDITEIKEHNSFKMKVLSIHSRGLVFNCTIKNTRQISLLIKKKMQEYNSIN